MHELAVCRELLGHLAVLARAHPATVARRVVVEMGPLSEVDPTRLIEAFSILSSETVARQATLAVETLPLRMRCGECGCQLGRALAGCVCPECGQDRSVLENGDGLELRLVEFAEAPRERLDTRGFADPTGIEGPRMYRA
jgi:hydrogenase nickel incorporation protein HypA/HybF